MYTALDLYNYDERRVVPVFPRLIKYVCDVPRVGICLSLQEHSVYPKAEFCYCKQRFLSFVCSGRTTKISTSGVGQSTILLCPPVVVICGFVHQTFFPSFMSFTAINVHGEEKIFHPRAKFNLQVGQSREDNFRILNRDFSTFIKL